MVRPYLVYLALRMYLRSLTIQNLKLLRDVAISFTRADG